MKGSPSGPVGTLILYIKKNKELNIMKIMGNPEKDKDGQMEIMVMLSFPEIQYFKQAVNLVLQHNLGDKDDIEQVKLGNYLADMLLEIKNRLKPA